MVNIIVTLQRKSENLPHPLW